MNDKEQYLVHIYQQLPPMLPRRIKLYIACQFALESNFGTSHLAVAHNNHSGMKRAFTRITTRLEEYDKFAHYACLNDCITDYLLWLSMKGGKLLMTVTELLDFIQSYCPDNDYVTKVINLFLQYQYLLKSLN